MHIKMQPTNLQSECVKDETTTMILNVRRNVDSEKYPSPRWDLMRFVDFDRKFDSSTHFIELADGSKANVVLGKGNAKVKLFDVNGILQDVV